MNPSTASGRLVKDILWNFISRLELNNCHRCGLPMSRETFSIEPKIPWLDSENPSVVYFDQENISFSHLLCNIACARNVKKKYATKEEARIAQRECERRTRKYCPSKRKQQYQRTGK